MIKWNTIMIIVGFCTSVFSDFLGKILWYDRNENVFIINVMDYLHNGKWFRHDKTLNRHTENPT